MHEPIRVVIWTRHTLFREGIKALLNDSPIKVAGEAVTAIGSRRAFEAYSHGCHPAGSQRPGPHGLGSHSPHQGCLPRVKVLLLALEADATLIADCLRAGASAYLGNYDKPTNLKSAINGLCGREVRVFAA